MIDLFGEHNYSRRQIMGKKKKHPVKKMTEEDYANYVMSLKDEKPIEAVVPKDDEGDF